MAQTVVATGNFAVSSVGGTTTVFSTATAGIYSALIDLTPMVSGANININVNNCTIVASGNITVTQDNFSGAQTEPMFFQPPMHTNKGFSITVVGSSGTFPTIPFEITQF